MSYLPCLVCGRLSKGSRCPAHSGAKARGYGSDHNKLAERMIAAQPWCSICGHVASPMAKRCDDPECKRCPLQLDHVIPVRGGRVTVVNQKYQVVCAKCNREKDSPGYM